LNLRRCYQISKVAAIADGIGNGGCNKSCDKKGQHVESASLFLLRNEYSLMPT
jgi:hypothetical protein